MKNSVKIIIHILAAYQIFGGFLGIGLAVRIISHLKDLSDIPLPMIILAGLFYLFSIICGYFLFRSLRTGITLSLINQVLQVLNFAIGGYAYNYVAGFKIGFGINFIPVWQLKLNLSLSSFQFFINTETGKVFTGINLLALFLVYLIERFKDNMKIN